MLKAVNLHVTHDDLTFLGYLRDPGIRSDSQLLEGAVVCQGIYEDLIHQMIEYPRKKAHLSFEAIEDPVLRTRAPMYDEHALIPGVLVTGQLPMISPSWRLE